MAVSTASRMPSNPRSIVVLRALGLGDLLTAIPALRGLRRTYPRARLKLATSPWLHPLALRIDAIDDVVPIASLEELGRTWPCDLSVNLHGKGPESHEILHWRTGAPQIGFRHTTYIPDGPLWRVNEHERERWCRMLEHFGVEADPTDVLLKPPSSHPALEQRVIVHPGAKAASRRWPADRFAAVVRDLARRGESVVVTAGPGEEELAVEVAQRSRGRCHVMHPDLLTLDALVAASRLVVSGDTGIAHLAVAHGRPSVTLFGPTPAREWGPPEDSFHVALGNRTATQRRIDALGGRKPDPALLRVGVRDVTDAAHSLLA
jgi:ADP-heptose:LPS heptosyltransferase